MILNDELRELITARAPCAAEGRGAALGHALPAPAAFEAVRRGETTLQEINRVTFVS